MKKKATKVIKGKGPEMSVYELSVLMMKGFERITGDFNDRFEKVENNLETFKVETVENFRLVNEKISRIGEEQEKISQKLDRVNDKVNNTFYLGQELKRLDERVTKLESK